MSTLESLDGSRLLALDSALTIYTAADTKLLLANALQGARWPCTWTSAPSRKWIACCWRPARKPGANTSTSASKGPAWP